MTDLNAVGAEHGVDGRVSRRAAVGRVGAGVAGVVGGLGLGRATGAQDATPGAGDGLKVVLHVSTADGWTR